jgi:hypothetical protein
MAFGPKGAVQMKKHPLSLAIAAALALAACDTKTTVSEVDLDLDAPARIGGAAVLWKNGEARRLSGDGREAQALSVFASGQDVRGRLRLHGDRRQAGGEANGFQHVDLLCGAYILGRYEIARESVRMVLVPTCGKNDRKLVFYQGAHCVGAGGANLFVFPGPQSAPGEMNSPFAYCSGSANRRAFRTF